MSKRQRTDSKGSRKMKPRKKLQKASANLRTAQSAMFGTGSALQGLRIMDKDYLTTSLEPNGLPVPGLSDNNLLNGFREGTGDFERLGKRIELRSVSIKGRIDRSKFRTASAGGASWRLALVYDRSPNGQLVNYTDIFRGYQFDGTPTPANCAKLAGVDPDKNSRFIVLREQIGTIPANASATTVHEYQDSWDGTIDWYVKLKKLQTQFTSATGGTVASIGTGALYLILMSDATTSLGGFHGVARVRAFDI